MMLIAIAASAATGALLGGALFGGRQVHQNRKVMDAVYESMSAARDFKNTCGEVNAVVADDSTTIDAEAVGVESEDSDAHCIYSVGDTVFVPDGVISQGGFVIRPGNYKIKSLDGEYIVIQKRKKTRTWKVRVDEVEKRG